MSKNNNLEDQVEQVRRRISIEVYNQPYQGPNHKTQPKSFDLDSIQNPSEDENSSHHSIPDQ